MDADLHLSLGRPPRVRPLQLGVPLARTAQAVRQSDNEPGPLPGAQARRGFRHGPRAGLAGSAPFTEESCLYYPGADRDHPNLRFTIDDGTGEAIVDPHKLVMLSEGGILEAREQVLLLGTARRKGDTIEISRGDSPRSFFQRSVLFFVRHVLGRAARSGSARLLFSDPSRCFCLWDDLREQPFAFWRDNFATFGAVALPGVWVLVFALAALAIVDQKLSETLRESLQGFWTVPEAEVVDVKSAST